MVLTFAVGGWGSLVAVVAAAGARQGGGAVARCRVIPQYSRQVAPVS